MLARSRLPAFILHPSSLILHHRSRLLAVFALLFAVAAAAGPSYAQQSSPGRWEPPRLRRAIEDRYNVAPVREGVVLVPRRPMAGIKSIELSGETVAINGATVTGGELRDRLKGDADAVLALSYLEPAQRKALFEEPAEGGTQPASPQPSAGAPPEPGSATPNAPSTPAERSGGTTIQSNAKIHIGGSVTVGEQETVDGPVVAIGGPVTVNGEVREDVVAIGGSVHLGRTARVRGDVTAVGGRIDKDPQAEVTGKLNEVGIQFPHFRFRPVFWLPATAFLGNTFGAWVGVMGTLFRMVLFGLVALLVFLAARNPVGRIERVAAVEPWKAGLVGLFTELLFIPVFILTIIILAISIVGIPLLFFVPPLAILALITAFILGFTGVAYRVGRWAEERFHWTRQTPAMLLLVGLLGVWAITIVGRILSLGGWPLWVASSALLLVGFLVEYVAWTVGLGAAVMTRLGSRWNGSAAAVVPPVPPAAPPAS